MISQGLLGQDSVLYYTVCSNLLLQVYALVSVVHFVILCSIVFGF